jgi:RNA polymerase sigma-B factor
LTGQRGRPDRDRTRELFSELASLDSSSPAYRELRGELVEVHLPLVRYLAGRFAGRGESIEDLIQTGTIGLLHAIDRFDPDRGIEFSTFATPSIAGEIKRHFRDRGWMVRVPRRLQELQAALSAAVAELSQRLHRSPTIAELAEYLGVSEDQVIEATESAGAYSPLPIDAPSTSSGMSIADTLVDSDGALGHVELQEALRPALAGLPERERQALLLRFVENRTQTEIAALLGISQVHVSRLLSKTLTELRDKLPDVLAND